MIRIGHPHPHPLPEPPCRACGALPPWSAQGQRGPPGAGERNWRWPASPRRLAGWLALAGLLSAAPALGHEVGSGAAGESAPELAECRFLSLGGGDEEARVPLAPDRVAALLGVLGQTRVGGLIASALDRFQSAGIGGPDRPLRLYEVRREGGPAAEYFSSSAVRPP